MDEIFVIFEGENLFFLIINFRLVSFYVMKKGMKEIEICLNSEYGDMFVEVNYDKVVLEEVNLGFK